MDERLKQIWSGFQSTTSRSLTGGGVDNIAVPHRRDFAAQDLEQLPENFEGPAQAAFSALREDLAHKEKKFSWGKKVHAQAEFREAAPDQGHGAPDPFDGGELLKGLKATAMRTERVERDYMAYLSTDEGKKAFKQLKKKKRFGLF